MVTAVAEASKTLVEVDAHSQVEKFIDDLIAKHSKNSEMVNLMALEATSLATSVSSRSKELEKQGFLSRLWGDFTGKTQKVSARNMRDLAQSQYLGQQMLNKLAENNLMTYQMVVSLSDKVNRVVADVSETQQELAELNQNLATFFASLRQMLEAKFTSLERNDDLLFWKETLEFEPVYQGKTYAELTRAEKMVCLANEFYHHSHQQWSPRDLSFFKAVMVQVGHRPDEKVSLKEMYQSYQEQPALLEQLFKGIDAKPKLNDSEPLMPTLMGFGKLQALESSEAHVVDTILEYSPNASKQDVSLTLATKYVQQTSGRDLEREVPFFDVVMNLVEDLVFYNQLQVSQNILEAEQQNNVDAQQLIPQLSQSIEKIWMQGIWYWADAHDLPEDLIARDKAGLLQMTSLSLSGCDFTELPESIGNLTNLTQLDLSRCSSLTELPEFIGNLINLTQLDLSRCSSLTKLPESIGNLANLTQLNLLLCENFTKLPESIGNLTNLKQLNLFLCENLTKLPESIGNLTNLTQLNLGGCSSLTKLPKSIDNLTSCRIVR